jgi:protein tyrosine phosphatase (PTP) superfamily phosphohydrolase (DUF442 family)
MKRWGLRMGCALGIIAAFPLGYYLYVDVWCSNFHTVVPGLVYRSANPSSGDLAQWRRLYGIQTILDLRADGVTRSYPNEQRASDRNNMALEYIRLSAWRQPDEPTLRKLIELIETSRKPLLVHCQGGADRAGLASFIAAMAIGGQDYQQAQKQFSARYFHLLTDLPITRVLHLYRDWCRQQGLPTAGWPQFRHWAFDVYSTGDLAT